MCLSEFLFTLEATWVASRRSVVRSALRDDVTNDVSTASASCVSLRPSHDNTCLPRSRTDNGTNEGRRKGAASH